MDALTGLANRRAFLEFGEQCLKAPANGSIAFFLFDLDWFKGINDTHGHAMGDRVLRLFAQTLSANLPQGGFAGRLGGEEFAGVDRRDRPHGEGQGHRHHRRRRAFLGTDSTSGSASSRPISSASICINGSARRSA